MQFVAASTSEDVLVFNKYNFLIDLIMIKKILKQVITGIFSNYNNLRCSLLCLNKRLSQWTSYWNLF